MRPLTSCLALFFCVLLTISCGREDKKPLRKVIDNIKKDEPKPHGITYRFDSIPNDSALADFKARYSPEQLRVIGALNRIDPWRIRTGNKFVLPDTVLTDIMYYSPFPAQLEMFNHVPKLIIVQKRLQAVALYENGKLIRWGPSSTGKKSKPTPSGLYHTNFKKKLKISTVNGEWKMPWYFNIANFDGIGLHQYELPGYPASHSCIRLFKEDAIFIFNWADQWQVSEDGGTVTKKGTPVIVFGEYDFEGTPAWKQAVENPKVLQLTKEEESQLQDYAAKIKGVQS